MWGRLVTCGGLIIRLYNDAPQRQADYQSAAGCQPAPQVGVDFISKVALETP